MTTRNDDEDQALQTAIEESMIEQPPNTKAWLFDPPPAKFEDEIQSYGPRTRIEDRIQDLALRSAFELPLLHDPDGDTWIFIDPLGKQPEQDQDNYLRYTKRYQHPICVKKYDLSRHSSFLKGRFAPSAQFRTIRRRQLTSKLRNHPSIKYVIDLTPASEGEEAVYVTTEMCCSESVRLWFQAGTIWSVSKGLVSGEEEYTSVEQQKFSDKSINGIKTPKLSSVAEATRFRMPPEYSPVRHRSAIERVVAALIGADPKLDSAPKVWTTFAVAKYYGITKSPLTDYIVRWLRAYPNSYFLEVCPEVSLRIADGFENHDLARDAFALLVGEEALNSQVRSRLHITKQERNVDGRRKEDLPESYFTRIEYASKNLLDRIGGDFNDLAGDQMDWLEDLKEMQKLTAHSKPESQGAIRNLKSLLKEYVRGGIYKLLCVDYDCVPPPDFHHAGGEDLIQRPSLAKVWRTLASSERLMSRTFWKALLSFGLFEGSTNLDIKKGWGKGCASLTFSLEEIRQMRNGTYREIHNLELLDKICEIDHLLALHGQQPTVKLPDRTRSLHGQQQTVDLPDRTRSYAESNSHTVVYDSYSRFNSLHKAQLTPDPRYDPRDMPDLTAMPTQPVDIPRTAPSQERGVTQDQEIDLISFSPDRHLETPLTADEWWRANGTQSELPAFGRFAPLSTRDEDEDMKQEEGVTRERRNSWDSIEEKIDLRLKREPIPPPKKSMNNQNKQNDDLLKARTAYYTCFDLDVFFLQAKAFIRTVAEAKLQFTDQGERAEPHEVGITNTLVCLQDTEWKFMPLWAGGYDDGTGGVFNDQIPVDDIGFSTPGPEVHTGFTPANSSQGSSEFEVMDSDCGTVTVNTSMVNNRSVPDTLYRNKVYAADSIGSSTIDDFDMVTVDSAKEDVIGVQSEVKDRVDQGVETAREADHDVVHYPNNAIDETYTDIFDYDEEADDNDTEDSQTILGDATEVDDSEKEDDDMVLV